MSHSVVLPPVHDTSPPPFDDDDDENDIIPTIQTNQSSSPSPDASNNSNDDDWKSVDDNNDTNLAEIQEDAAIVNDEQTATNNDNNEANLAQVQEDTAIVNDEQIATNDDNNETTLAQVQGDTAIVIDEQLAINDDNNETNLTQVQGDTAIVIDEQIANNDDWANFATFEKQTDEVLETPSAAASAVIEENTENDWADFESNTVPSSEQPTPASNEEQTEKVIEDEDDDFGEFSEVQVASKPQPSSLPTETLSSEQIESLISTCFPMDSTDSSTETESFMSTELPSFTTYKDPTKQISYLEPSLSLWNVLSNLSNDPVGIKFQWRKSNTERLFHQALGANERLRTKTIPLTPEILQPEKMRSSVLINSASENIDSENKLSTEAIRPHFDWKQSGLQNPLANNDSSSLSSNISKNEENGYDANKSLDLDFYVPPMKSSTEEERTASPSSIQRIDSPIIPQQPSRSSIPIKTMDLFPGSTTTLSDDAKRIIDNLPNLNFMSAKALMFPIRFNANNNEESTTLY